MRVQYPKFAYGPYYELNPNKTGVYILVEVSFYIQTPKYMNISIGRKKNRKKSN